MPITNEQVNSHALLATMVDDAYYPPAAVAKAQRLILDLAERIEQERPDDEAVYALTQATVAHINELQNDFWASNSEIETMARDALAQDVEFVLRAYGYDVDLEAALANRDW
jgi:hypothetical protein